MFNLHPTIQHERIPVTEGRFPANTILTYNEIDKEEVCGGFPNTKSGKNGIRKSEGFNKNDYRKGIGIKKGMNNGEYGDSGSASRYFYCAKASAKDRDEGLGYLEKQRAGSMMANIGDTMSLGGASLSGNPKEIKPKRNIHPTVKPTELMQYFVRLVTPKGRNNIRPIYAEVEVQEKQ